ncbi:MAG: preprotein translocase subunit YajC, partial [Clostridia bacterium]|nr:preprotein translocase subunit YajC [Clostridia bacterium]
MLNSLLAAFDPQSIIMLVIVAVLIVVIVVFYVLSSKKRKKQEQDAQDLINAVKPGNKVKTIGGICGIVVEVDNEENTFVLETGTEVSGKSYIKFDRQAIYQTDAVVEKKEVSE